MSEPIPTPSPVSPDPLRSVIRHELSEVRSSWGGFLAIGIALIVLGTLLIAAPWIGTIATVWMISTLLILCGVLELVAAFWVRAWSGFFLALLGGVLYIAVGILMFDRPVAAAATLTLLIAAFLIIGGVFRIVTALSLRFDGWGWMTVGGILSTLLGLMIWWQWPEASLWVIGLYVGIEVLFTGWTWVMLSMLLRRLPRAQ